MIKLVGLVIGLSLIAGTASADITMICNPQDGYSEDQHNNGVPGTIMATLVTSNNELAGSTISIEVDELQKLSNVEYNTPDEEMVSATYTLNNTRYEIMLYIGGENIAEHYKVDAAGNEIEGTKTTYQCGSYDDGKWN